MPSQEIRTTLEFPALKGGEVDAIIHYVTWDAESDTNTRAGWELECVEVFVTGCAIDPDGKETSGSMLAIDGDWFDPDYLESIIRANREGE